MIKTEVAIIGGGAAGLACAVTLKKLKPDTDVTLIDANDRLGKKLAATGNGQGNVSNVDMTSAHFHGSGKKYAEKLCCSGEYDTLSLFDFLFVTDQLGRVYPAGKQASALSDCLIRKIADCGVERLSGVSVTDVSDGFLLSLSNGEKLKCERLVIAAGGKAQKQFGTDGFGFRLAEKLEHSITSLYPSLVQLKTETKDIKTLKGIRAECGVTLLSPEKKTIAKTRGDVIFTDYGVSGNAIFYISAYCAGRQGCTLSLEFLPQFTQTEIEGNIKRRIADGCPSSELLCGTLHNQIGRAVIKRCLVSDAAAIARTVKNFTLKIEGTLGFDYAQVTRGGVAATEFDENMRSKKCKNLYFAGEVVDVDGDCGGYNLQWAFASGMRAARSVAEDIAND